MAKGQILGYVRVSTADQNAARQFEGIVTDRIFEDRISGKNADRPALQELLAYVREGDAVVVHSMDRLARNLDDLRRLVADLTARGIRIQFLKESLTFTGDDSSMSKLLLNIMGAFAEFERSLILERQKEGIALAKERGAYKGRKAALDTTKVAILLSRHQAGEAVADLARSFNLSRETIYQYLRRSAQGIA
jgi:DNA invertase Pin-like site-specific DNA recombinase